MARTRGINEEANKVLESAFINNVNPFKDKQLQSELLEFYESRITPKNDRLAVKIYVDDTEKKHWRKGEHFVKVFHSELRHIEEYLGLPKSIKNFLRDLGEFLMWETNLLVDEEDSPLNQQMIAEKLYMHPKTVGKYMKELRLRKIIFEIKIWKEKYYMVNPYVMFTGQYINESIPKLFDELGYINEKSVR